MAGQIVLDDGLGGVLLGLELALDVGRREATVTININEVHVRLGVAQQGKLLAGLPELGCSPTRKELSRA